MLPPNPLTVTTTHAPMTAAAAAAVASLPTCMSLHLLLRRRSSGRSAWRLRKRRNVLDLLALACERGRTGVPRRNAHECWLPCHELTPLIITACTYSWNDGASTADSIPAYQPPRLAASPPRLPLLEAVQQPSTGLVPVGGPTRGAAAATAVPSAANGLVQAAQMEALRLQVAQLRKSNVALQQQLAGANAARAAAAKQAALNQLSLLALEPVTAEGTAPHEAHAAAADALLGELGALLPPGRDAVPLAYVQQLHASYMQRLEEQQQRHADALAAQAEEVQARLQRQVGGHGKVLAIRNRDRTLYGHRVGVAFRVELRDACASSTASSNC